MRLVDILRLSLSALWQQKVRTLLTVAGITIGTLVLAVSLSLEQGFQDEVARQLRHGDQLRQVWVFPNKSGKPVLLTGATVTKLRNLPHVELVAPMGSEVCDVCLNRDLLRPQRVAMAVGHAAAPPGPAPLLAWPALLPWSRPVTAFVARPNDEHLRERLIAGSYLSSAEANEVLVSKGLVRQLALDRGQPMEWLVGQKLNVVFPSRFRSNMQMNRLLHLVDQALAPSESRAVRKLLMRLWQSGNRTILTAHERTVMEKIVRRELGVSSPAVGGKNPTVPGKGTLPGKKPVVTRKDPGLKGKDADERAVLTKVRQEIEAVRADLKLTDGDRRALEKVLRRYLGEPQALVPGQSPFHEDLVIVGVLRDFEKEDQSTLGFTLAAQMDNIDLFLSPATAERLYRHGPEWQEVGYFGVFVTVDREENLKEVAAAVKDMGLREVSLLPVVDKIQAGVAMVTFLTSFLALMAALAAALGITNIMFMSVLERTREIGVMKAVGASERHIQLIFLVEGWLLGVLGGALGVLGCWLVSFPGDAYARRLMAEYTFGKSLIQSPFVFPWWLVLGVPFFAGVVTTLAAVLPARRAARVDPIQALRHE